MSETIIRSEEFTRTLDTLKSGRNVVLTGKAGTGKSTLLRTFLDEYQGRKNILVTAPTGVAALNIGGSTIHRAFGFRPGLYPDNLYNDWTPSQETRKVLRTIDVLVVDEISMVRADLFDIMDLALRKIRESSEPFGGIQLVLVGDLLQLPPVITDNEREYFNQNWSAPYFFAAKCYPKLDIHKIELQTVWRQNDEKFIEILNQVREGSVGENTLAVLNEYADPEFSVPDDWVTLTPLRRYAEKLNLEHLNNLGSEIFSSEAVFEGEADEKSFSGTTRLKYAVGARVMTIINDPADRFINGSFGTITEASDNVIVVKLDTSGRQVALSRHTWEIIRPDVVDGRLGTRTTGSVTQFPVVLAWAMTIHRAQGKTIPKLFINLSGGTHIDGQFYVALSRGVSLDNLRFDQPVEARHIRANNSLVRTLRRGLAPEITTKRVAFFSADGVDFGMSNHIVRCHVSIVDDGAVVADFGTWINPMADLGAFGIKNNVPGGGLALAPTLGDFWPLLRRQVAGSMIVGDGLSLLERAVRVQEKGLDLGLGIGYDFAESSLELVGDDVTQRCHAMVDAFRAGRFSLSRGVPAPEAAPDDEGAVFIPTWAPYSPMRLDPQRATESDRAWAAFSGGEKSSLDQDELIETTELLAAWAISRDGWTKDAYTDLKHRAESVGLYSLDLPAPIENSHDIADLCVPGTRIAVTGRNNFLGGPASDERLVELFARKDLEYKKAVSKSRCDVLIASDPSSMSRKAQAAREYGKPIISQADFEAWYRNESASEPVFVSEKPPAETPALSQRWVKADEFLQEGTRISFRGSTYIFGKLFPQGDVLQRLCEELGLNYKQAVTKTRCDVLVTDNPDAQDGKMSLASRYDVPLLDHHDFRQWAEAKLLESIKEESPSPKPAVPVADPVEEDPEITEDGPSPEQLLQEAETLRRLALGYAPRQAIDTTEDPGYLTPASKPDNLPAKKPNRGLTALKWTGIVFVSSFVLAIVFSSLPSVMEFLVGVAALMVFVAPPAAVWAAVESIKNRRRD